jgi:hypothetical protein
MENNEPITLEDKKRLNAMFKSEEGELFIKLLKDMHEAHLDLAQGMYLKVVTPAEQTCAQVNQAAGIKEVLGFIEATEQEVAEAKKEEEEKK